MKAIKTISKKSKKIVNKIVEEEKIIEINNDIINYKELINTNNKIKNIYHMSDIHIRTSYFRDEEYKQVFDKVYKILKKKDITQSIIVITGDIVHQKSIITPDSFDLVESFIKKLSEIMPVIFIAGNHDVNLVNNSMSDILSRIFQNLEDRNTTSIVMRNECKNIYYLKYSGIYRYENILFGLSSLLDKKIIKANELLKYKNKNDKLIGLYHGGIGNFKTACNFEIKSDIDINKFIDYDLVLLGDIHKFQYLNDEKTIAYASSLIAQDFSEADNYHGILEWDIETKKSEYIKIENDYEYVTYKIDRTEIEIYENKYNYTNINSKLIPDKARVRLLVTEQTTETEIMNMKEQLKIIKPLINIKQIHQEITKTVLTNEKQSILKKENIKTLLEKYLEYKDIKDEQILNLYEEMRDGVDMDKNEIMNDKWEILTLKFSNLFGYGEDNKLDFRKLPDNKVIGLFSPNSYGKSSLIDAITFSIFGIIGRLSNNSTTVPEEIMNENKDNCECSIEILINDTVYIQTKTCKRIKISKKSVNKLDSSSKIEVIQRLQSYNIKKPSIITDLTQESRLDTEKYLIKLIGTYDNFIQSSICYQNAIVDYMFRQLKPVDKALYLKKILNLEKLDYIKDKINIKIDDIKIDKNKLEGKIKDKTLSKYDQDLNIIKHNNVSYVSIEMQNKLMVIYMDVIIQSIIRHI
jgi:predicted MPP superfamily phosphohydrolase